MVIRLNYNIGIVKTKPKWTGINDVHNTTFAIYSRNRKGDTDMSKKRKVSTHKDVQEHLICAICTDIFKDPRNLECGHVFCKGCLDGLHRSNPLEVNIPCPLCKRRTKLKETRVDGLPRNLPIKGLLDQDLNEDPEPPPKRSRLCTTHNEEQAEIYCNDCKRYACFVCFKANHSDHNTETRNIFLRELRKKSDDAKEQYKDKQRSIDNKIHAASVENQKYISDYPNQERKVEEDFRKDLTILKQRRELKLFSLKQSRRRWEKDYENLKQRSERWKTNLETLVPELESTTVEDLDGEDLVSYITKVDTVQNLLETDLNVDLAPPVENHDQAGPSSASQVDKEVFRLVFGEESDSD